MTVETTPTRRIIQADALVWMRENEADPFSSVITSLPDLTELALDFDGWRSWFIEAARQVIRWTPQSGVAIFYQSDIRHRGAWIDKGYLVMRALQEEEARGDAPCLLWHKIVCRQRPGTIALGRPSYSHMLCITRDATRGAMRRPGPDVLEDAGSSAWSRAMPSNACSVACRFLREETAARIVVDPFCGRGSVLAVANAMGFDAIGIDVSAKRCRAARAARASPPSR